MKQLTERQTEVLTGFLSGMTYRQLAADLGISPGTINPHLKQIRDKLGADGFSRSALRDAWERWQGVGADD